MSPTGWTRALDPTPDGYPTQSWGAGYLFPIKGAEAFADGEAEEVEGIEVVDDHTLKLTLDEPTTTFLLGLTVATSWPVPKEAVAERGEEFKSRPVGAGPFFISEWNPGSDITIARNPGYVDPEPPYLDEIHIDLGVDENTQVVRLESGEADGVFEQFAPSPASLRLLAENPDLATAPSVGPRIFYLALNNDGIFADKRLRQAVAHAMSTDFIVQFGDLARPWNQLISSTTAQSDPEGSLTYLHDSASASLLLEEAVYDGTPVKIVYDVTDPYTSANATALTQDLEAIGFTVDLRGLQKTQFYNDIYDPTLYDISSTYWSADYPDAQDFISTNFTCGSIDILNISRFCHPGIDEEFYATEQMPFGPERDEALRAVQQRLIDDVAGIPVMEVTPRSSPGRASAPSPPWPRTLRSTGSAWSRPTAEPTPGGDGRPALTGTRRSSRSRLRVGSARGEIRAASTSSWAVARPWASWANRVRARRRSASPSWDCSVARATSPADRCDSMARSASSATASTAAPASASAGHLRAPGPLPVVRCAAPHGCTDAPPAGAAPRAPSRDRRRADRGPAGAAWHRGPRTRHGALSA